MCNIFSLMSRLADISVCYFVLFVGFCFCQRLSVRVFVHPCSTEHVVPGFASPTEQSRPLLLLW